MPDTILSDHSALASNWVEGISPNGADTCTPKVGDMDERGNTVKYIYACDRDYIVYYSRLEARVGTGDSQAAPGWVNRQPWLRPIRRLFRRDAADPAYECEGVYAQLSCDPETRKVLRKLLLPLGTERAKLQALLKDWPRRQSYDSSIATALQLALDGRDSKEANDTALQILKGARESVMAKRGIAGKAQYVKFTLLIGLVSIFLLILAQHNLFHGSGHFWLGAQAGLLGAMLSIAIGIRGKTVALDLDGAGNLSDSALRLIIGAVSGGTLVLLSATGLLPSLHTLAGEQNAALQSNSMLFAMLLGIVAGFVEKLVPSLLDEQGQRLGNTSAGKPAG
jgi:hypothetical protein